MIESERAKALAFWVGVARYANAAAYYNDLMGRPHAWYYEEGYAWGKVYSIALGDEVEPGRYSGVF